MFTNSKIILFQNFTKIIHFKYLLCVTSLLDDCFGSSPSSPTVVELKIKKVKCIVKFYNIFKNLV